LQKATSNNLVLTREIEITGALKFENCKFEYNFNVTARKEK
jgi:hypothetical protein